MSSNPSSLIALLEKFRRDEMRQEAAVLKQIGNAYAKVYERLSSQIELEVRRMIENGGDNLSRAYIRSRLSSLYDQMEEELKKYSNFVEATIDANTDDMLRLGSRHALELMRLSGNPVVGIDFDRLNTDQINTIIGFLSPGSPLRERLDQLAGYNAPIIRDQLVEAIALGYNPYKTAKLIAPYLSEVMKTAKNGFASVLATAVRTARTAQLWSYREAQRANYQANSDIISGWQWYAQIADPKTCMSCIALHGSIHPLSEPCDDHPHGRCTPLPVVLGKPLISETAGVDYFNGLSEEEQRARMGNGAYESWQAGAFTLSDLSKQVPDDVYGSFHVVPSLKELLGVD